MKQPTISQARIACQVLGARGVIVLAFSEEHIAGSSYGETKAECKQLARVMDDMIWSIQKGDIQVWETAGRFPNDLSELPGEPASETAGPPLEELTERVGDCETCGRPSTLCYCSARRSNR